MYFFVYLSVPVKSKEHLLLILQIFDIYKYTI